MSSQQHKIFDLAAGQLQVAVILFLYEQDKFSAITLAGAADVLLCQLVKKKGQENFTEFLKRESDDEDEQKMPLGEFGNRINNMAAINDMKHFDPGDNEQITMDLDQCALTAILKALPNFCDLGGRNYKFVIEFLAWAKATLDPEIYNVDCDPDWKSAVG